MNPDNDFWTPSRTISAVVVVVYMALAVAFRGGESAARVLLFCLLPLMCIWFPDFMGGYRGIGVAFPRVINETSPPSIVFILGWVTLSLPVVAVLIMYFCS